MKIFKKMKKGFTLVELVVVIAVIAILAAVSVGAYFGVTESANNSRLEQEAKQVYTAIQTVSLAPNEHSSLSKDGLVITDDSKFELALEETLGKNVTLLENGDKAASEPTIYFVRKAISPAITENVVYSSFDYHVAEIDGKKAVTDIVTGEAKVETSDVETGEGSSTTTVPGATSNPTTAPSTSDTTQAPLYEDGWHLVTTASEIKDGDQIIVAGYLEGVPYSISTNDKGNNRGVAEISVSENVATLNTHSLPINVNKDGEYFTFSTSAGYLHSGTGEKDNHLKTFATLTDNGRWVVDITNNIASIVSIGDGPRHTMQLNPNNGSPLFACYDSAKYESLYIFKNYGEEIVETSPTVDSVSFKSQPNYNEITELNYIGELPNINIIYNNGAMIQAASEDIEWTSNDNNLIEIDGTSFEVVGYGDKTVTFTATHKTFEKSVSFDLVVKVIEKVAGQETTYSYTFTKKVFSAFGSAELDGIEWNVEGDGNFFGYQGGTNTGHQFGSSSNPCKNLSLNTSAFKDKEIKKVSITVFGTSDIKCSMVFNLDGVQKGETIGLTTAKTTYEFECNATSTNNIEFLFTQTSSKQIIINSFSITYIA